MEPTVSVEQPVKNKATTWTKEDKEYLKLFYQQMLKD
jgi:hypothetical protein